MKEQRTLQRWSNLNHKSTNHKIFPFAESDKDLHDKTRQDMTDGPSIVFTRKAAVDQTYIRNSKNIRKSIVGIDASQLYPFSLCQEMPTGLYTRWELDTNSQNSKLEPINREHFRTCSCLIFNHSSQNALLKTVIQPGNRKWLSVLMWMNFVLIATQYPKPWAVISIFAHVTNLEQASRRRKCREELEKENIMSWEENIWETKDTILLKSGSLTGVNVLKKGKMSEITWGRTFPSNYLCSKSLF